MSTDFFQRQATARQSTTWLLVLFFLATLAIVMSVMGVAAVVVATQQKDAGWSFAPETFPWEIPLMAGIGTLLLILGGSFFKVIQLRAGGGAAVAERMGGIRVFPNATDPVQRRLLNVVEEMAIASGITVPPVFLLGEEQGINAFAAGYSTDDAVLGVTRGCAEKLTREQLQGVLAHEFSHILNGDMRIGIRVMGILHGILLMGLVGQLVFRSMAYSGHARSRRNNNSGNAVVAVMLFAVALIVLGFIGTIIGNLIKAAVSRQRERLADASGVQFTRNPFGLAGALKRIGALEIGSRLQAPNAAEASHLFFAEGVWPGIARLWSTHPPLADRIRTLDPSWDGNFPPADDSAPGIARELSKEGAIHASFTDTPASQDVPLQLVDGAVEHVGNPSMAHVHYAASVMSLMPKTVIDAAREPYAARAIVFCLLLHRDKNIRAQQLCDLNGLVTPDVASVLQRLIPIVDRLDDRVRLPLVDVALPALAAMSTDQYRSFVRAFETLAQADGQLDLFEWVLSQIVVRHLRPHFEAVRRDNVRSQSLSKMASHCAVVLSSVAYGGNSDSAATSAFSATSDHFPELSLKLLARSAATLPHLRESLSHLAYRAKPVDRGRLVDACAAAISVDGHATVEEVELLRGISDLLGCPMPPLLLNQE